MAQEDVVDEGVQSFDHNRSSSREMAVLVLDIKMARGNMKKRREYVNNAKKHRENKQCQCKD